jgi:hypothetical protein
MFKEKFDKKTGTVVTHLVLRKLNLNNLSAYGRKFQGKFSLKRIMPPLSQHCKGLTVIISH